MRLAPTPPPSMVTTTASEASVGISTPAYSTIILAPIKPSTSATAVCKYFNSPTALEINV